MSTEERQYKVGERLEVHSNGGKSRWEPAHDRVVTVTALDTGRVQLWWACRWRWYRINRSGSLTQEARYDPEVLVVKGTLAQPAKG